MADRHVESAVDLASHTESAAQRYPPLTATKEVGPPGEAVGDPDTHPGGLALFTTHEHQVVESCHVRDESGALGV
jgi:hypothetical protein